MDIPQILFGYLVSTLGGALVLWIVIDQTLWPEIVKKHNVTAKKESSLTVWLGIIERASYTTAFVLKLPAWIGIYLAMKIAVGWRANQKRESPSDNLYLIGTLLSIFFGLLGAWIILGELSF